MKRQRKIFLIGIITILCLVAMTGCVKRKKAPSGNANVETDTTIKDNVRYNAQDTAIITEIDSKNSQISVVSVSDKDKKYILNYNKGTSIKNKYGSEIMMSDMYVGEIVDVFYVAGTQKLINMQASLKMWENDSVTRWNIDYDSSVMTIGDNNYKYSEDLFIESNGKKIKIDSISSVDTLMVKGIDSQIYSIVVKTGHGYIRLTDSTNLVGGIVQIGNKLMTEITKDMVIVAPEGEYTLTASKDGKGGSTNVNVKRDDEVTVSLSGFHGEIEKNGSVKFTIKPEEASINLFIDGKEVNENDVIDLSYGVHDILITSDSYVDYKEKITINSLYINKTIDLSKVEKETETTSGSSEEAKVTISKPVGASLYLDGIYMGSIPHTFEKEAGTHVVILRQSGYDTVVYNIELSDDSKDVNLSFPNMEKSK